MPCFTLTVHVLSSVLLSRSPTFLLGISKMTLVLRSTTAYTEFKELDMKDVMGRQGYACHEQEFNTQ